MAIIIGSAKSDVLTPPSWIITWMLNIKEVHGKPRLHPCIRLARLKFELTNQHSAGGKIFSVLTSWRLCAL